MGILSSPHKSERLRENLRSAVAQGYHTGKLPFGYTYPERYGDTSVVIQEEAKVVREVFRLALAWHTISEIALLLGRTRMHGRSGPFSRSSIHSILRNPYYVGMVRLNGETYPGIHEAIVSEAEFERANKLLRDKRPVRVSERVNKILGSPLHR